jgi:hypothetical protein
MKGAKKKIISESFRDRFQVDLIDMRGCAQEDIYGQTMRWIMTLKDHFSHLTYLVALPQKKVYRIYQFLFCKDNSFRTHTFIFTFMTKDILCSL